MEKDNLEKNNNMCLNINNIYAVILNDKGHLHNTNFSKLKNYLIK